MASIVLRQIHLTYLCEGDRAQLGVITAATAVSSLGEPPIFCSSLGHPRVLIPSNRMPTKKIDEFGQENGSVGKTHLARGVRWLDAMAPKKRSCGLLLRKGIWHIRDHWWVVYERLAAVGRCATSAEVGNHHEILGQVSPPRPIGGRRWSCAGTPLRVDRCLFPDRCKGADRYFFSGTA